MHLSTFLSTILSLGALVQASPIVSARTEGCPGGVDNKQQCKTTENANCTIGCPGVSFLVRSQCISKCITQVDKICGSCPE
ncbi:uncharacterized protein RCC_06226 [Ramularia collo-cygni]|uniref:Uncharacterized protein n=1 Tax=Ramularia collo-cygni TaxID=112498 RepID=A0A2D3V6N5_9PEZI|nr:uncharacterized protein RCC_06226 [Ramularia collo-cygni]CZT20367.1 uncharacterized protein RCC_06226 [Ramularia collo-cygni]